MRPRGNNTMGVSLPVLLALLALILTPAPPGQATDGRDFAGFYSVSNATDLGDTVRLTLTARVTNFSDADVTDAIVTLTRNIQPDQDYGSFAAISFTDRESVRLSGEFTIPKDEYTFWQESGYPAMRIEYRNAAGDSVQRRIELSLSAGEEL